MELIGKHVPSGKWQWCQGGIHIALLRLEYLQDRPQGRRHHNVQPDWPRVGRRDGEKLYGTEDARK